MKTVFEGVKAELDKIAVKAAGYLQKTEVMRKKVSDEKNNSSQSFSGEREAGACLHPKSVSGVDMRTMQKHWSRSVVFTDAWACDTDTDEQKLPEEELQQGELWAVTFRVGCYIVRAARRIYRVYDPGYNPDKEVPADKDEIELIKKDMEIIYGCVGQCSGSLNSSANLYEMVNSLYGIDSLSFELREKLRDTLEISARHISNPGSEYTYIYRTTSERYHRWYETVESIYTAKEHARIPNEYASLIVRICYVGDSFSNYSWYKLDPTGKITTLSEGFGRMDDDACFK